MNRNLLLIALVAVAGFAVGVLILQAQQPGAPLPGSMGPGPTTLALGLSCSVPDGTGNVTYTVSGMLRDVSGAPVAARTVEVTRLKCDSLGCTSPGPDEQRSVATGQDGRFGFVKREPQGLYDDATTHTVFYATFAGDALYGGSQSGFQTKRC